MIVIGDVHGCYKTLLALIEKLPKDEQICFAGDLVDRGPGSAQVVQHVIDNGHLSVRGNHEQMMIDYDNGYDRENWLMNGGTETLASYNNNEVQFKAHVQWMKNLPVFLEFKDVVGADGRHLVVSHASLGHVWHWSPEKRKEHKKMFESQVTWNRGTPEDAAGIYNVFGHTPQKEPRVKSFYANVDTGAVFSGRDVYGKLTAIQYPSLQVWQQENIDV